MSNRLTRRDFLKVSIAGIAIVALPKATVAAASPGANGNQAVTGWNDGLTLRFDVVNDRTLPNRTGNLLVTKTDTSGSRFRSRPESVRSADSVTSLFEPAKNSIVKSINDWNDAAAIVQLYLLRNALGFRSWPNEGEMKAIEKIYSVYSLAAPLYKIVSGRGAAVKAQEEWSPGSEERELYESFSTSQIDRAYAHEKNRLERDLKNALDSLRDQMSDGRNVRGQSARDEAVERAEKYDRQQEWKNTA